LQAPPLRQCCACPRASPAAIGVALGAATVVGGTVLSDASETLVGTAEAIAAGAVLAVISIVPMRSTR
jgi:hypothetical protein